MYEYIKMNQKKDTRIDDFEMVKQTSNEKHIIVNIDQLLSENIKWITSS